MSGHGFPKTCIFPHKHRLCDYLLIREDTGQGKPTFWYILERKKDKK